MQSIILNIYRFRGRVIVVKRHFSFSPSHFSVQFAQCFSSNNPVKPGATLKVTDSDTFKEKEQNYKLSCPLITKQ